MNTVTNGPDDHNKNLFEEMPVRIRPGLSLLLEAVQYAEQTNGKYWEFAIEIDQLLALGFTQNDFRWMVRKGLVKHQREVTLECDNGREFRSTGDLIFYTTTCFILTDLGVSVAKSFITAASTVSMPISSNNSSTELDTGETYNSNQTSNRNGSNGGPPVPTWDAELRSLYINGKIVKQYRWPAANQETVLAAFEEDGWPPRIDDPLPPKLDQDSKRRLSDTIKCLNRKQSNQIIHFRGDGTGEGVVWELVKSDFDLNNAG